MTAEPVAHGKPAALATKSRLRLEHVFGTAFICGPILAAVTPLGMAPLFTVVALAAVALYLRDHRTWPWPQRAMLVIALTFIAWLALSALWTVALPETIRFLPRAILYVIMGLALVVTAQRLPVDERRIADLCLIVGVAFGAMLFAVEIATDGAIAAALHQMVKGEARVFEAGSLNRGAAVFAILAFPSAIAARRRFGWPAGLAILAAVLGLTLPVQGIKAALGAAVGLSVIGIALASLRRVAPLLASAILVVIVTAPLQPAMLAAIPGPWVTSESASVKHRLIIWDFVAERISERPFLGWGLNSSRAIPGGKFGPHEGTELLPLHPHNVGLQLWLELGGVGALLAGLGLASATLALGRLFRDPLDLGLAAAAVASACAMAAVGYGMWQGWWISTLWLVAATLAAVAPAADQSGPAQDA